MALRRVDKVMWGEGMLVCPQHLQQQDLFYEQLIQARATWPNPYAWGLSRLEIDEPGVKNGELRVNAVQGILPGGMPIDFSDGDSGLPPPRSIAEHFPSTMAVAEVFLGVAQMREGTENYARTDGTGNGSSIPRYDSWSRDVVDLVRAESEAQVVFARPRPVVLFGSEDRQDYETIKIAELRRDQQGGFELSHDYVPPCLRLSGSTILQRWSKELLGLMLTKRRAILESLRQVDASRVEFTAQDVTRYLQLGAINSHLPLVRQLTESPESLPYTLYTTLSQLAGQLTSFSTEITPEELPMFAHLDLRATFGDLFAKLRALLELAMKENFIDVALEARRDGMWIGVMKDPRVLECTTFVLAVEADAQQQEVANRLPSLSKIASWKQISRIVRSAIPGAPLTATHRPPPQIPIRPRIVYFLVDTRHEYWQQITDEKTIAVFLPPPFDPTRAKLKLMAVPEVSRT